MSLRLKKYGSVLGMLAIAFSGFAQCDIHNRISADGLMMYYLAPERFYETRTKSLQGCIVTDKESYFLELLPTPFPPRPEGHKLNKDLVLKLSNGKTCNLTYYDTRYEKNGSVMAMMYLINNEEIKDILKFEAVSAAIDMMGTEGIRVYKFKLHKTALMDQLSCFLKDKEKKK